MDNNKNNNKKNVQRAAPRFDNDQLGENASGEGVKGTNCPTANKTTKGGGCCK